MRTGLWLATSGAALAACAHQSSVPVSDAAEANLRDRDGNLVATARLRDTDGIAVTVTANGLPAGTYAVHIHAVGLCERPGFESAGPHWNPASRQHGRLNPRGPHLGDLPNLTVGREGRGRIEFVVAAGAVRSSPHPLLDADGAAVVIHAGADDERTDPSGNSGARIACGVLG